MNYIQDVYLGYLVLNLIFLCNIVRVLHSKLRATCNTVRSHETNRKAVCATLILIPLLGLHHISFPIRPEVGPTAEIVYQFILALLVSLQVSFTAVTVPNNL